MDFVRTAERAIAQDLRPTEHEIAEYLSGRMGPRQDYGFRNRGQVVQQYSRGDVQHYATGPGYPSATNVTVPTHEASGYLTTGYSRNAKRFLLPRYVKYVPSTKNVGLYMKMSFQEQTRVVTTQEYAWAPGQKRPRHTDGMEQFLMVPYKTDRYDYGASFDDDTERLATWPITQQLSRVHCTKLMTSRTVRMLTEAVKVANWQIAADADLTANHTDTAANFVGGFLDQGTTSTPYIKEFFNRVAVLIDLETAGAVDAKDMWFIINPNQALLWGLSAEIMDFIKGSVWAGEELRNGLSPNNRFGVPSRLYGYNILIENASRITTRKGATLTKQYILPDKTVLCVSRPGGLIGVEGFSDFSTLILPWYRDEMTLETRTDSYNRLVDINVCEQNIPIVASPPSGFLLTLSTSA